MLRVSVLELPAAWGDPSAALAHADALIAESPPSDLVLLPEQSLTGYVSPRGDFDCSRFAEPIDGPISASLSSLAKQRAIHLCAPLVLAEDSTIYNAMLCFAPDGDLLFTYRKQHPWIPEDWATPGPSAPPLVTIADVKVTICICYDIHFIADESPDLLREADLLLFPTAWVDRHDTRVPTIRDLARDFALTIANANWNQGIVRVPGQGGSLIIAPDGKVLGVSATISCST
jgi:predicted amidohydrolase